METRPHPRVPRRFCIAHPPNRSLESSWTLLIGYRLSGAETVHLSLARRAVIMRTAMEHYGRPIVTPRHSSPTRLVSRTGSTSLHLDL